MPALVVDSVTELEPAHMGAVVVAGSHGGVYAAWLAATARVRAVVLNDAGRGLDDAGIASLGWLDRIGLPAAVVAHDSARIGDGRDMLQRGVLSGVNVAAAELGCAPGQSCREAVVLLQRARPPQRLPEPLSEARVLLREGAVPIWALDSNSIVTPSDEGAIIITGSHGGLLGGRPETALRVDARAAVYNDAGIGADRAGVSRLPVLSARGIAAATVAAASARIGEARSTWETGILSAVNDVAATAGCAPGQSVRHFAELVIAAAARNGT